MAFAVVIASVAVVVAAVAVAVAVAAVAVGSVVVAAVATVVIVDGCCCWLFVISLWIVYITVNWLAGP